MNAADVLRRVLKYTAVLAVVIAVLGGAAGYLAAGADGLWSALIGTGMAVLFAGITAASIIVALRFSLTVFLGIVLGAWLVKAALFIVLLVVVRDLPIIDPLVLFLSLVAAIVGTLAIDVVVVVRARMPYPGTVALPGDDPSPRA